MRPAPGEELRRIPAAVQDLRRVHRTRDGRAGEDHLRGSRPFGDRRKIGNTRRIPIADRGAGCPKIVTQ